MCRTTSGPWEAHVEEVWPQTCWSRSNETLLLVSRTELVLYHSSLYLVPEAAADLTRRLHNWLSLSPQRERKRDNIQSSRKSFDYMAAPDKQNSASPPDKPNSFRVGTPISEMWFGRATKSVCPPISETDKSDSKTERSRCSIAISSLFIFKRFSLLEVRNRWYKCRSGTDFAKIETPHFALPLKTRFGPNFHRSLEEIRRQHLPFLPSEEILRDNGIQALIQRIRHLFRNWYL